MADKHKKTLVILLGPTAVGKTKMGVQLAIKFGTEVLSADSRQFYREMKIGTALPEMEELAGIRHHFLANLSIHDDYNVYSYEQEAMATLEKLFSKYDIVLLVGGSGLYIDALTKGIDDLPDADLMIRDQLKKTLTEKGLEPLREKLKLMDPDYFEIVDQKNPNRIMRALEVCMITGKPYSSLRKNEKKERSFAQLKIGLGLPRAELFDRINRRVDRMIDKGLLDEVNLLYRHRDLNALKTVGYTELFSHLDGQLPLDEAVEKIKTNTRRYAKRQLTWFKRDHTIKWFRPDEYQNISTHIQNQLANSK